MKIFKKQNRMKKTGPHALLALIFFLVQVNSAWSFANKKGFTVHVDITTEALTQGSIPGLLLEFSETAIDQINSANVDADNGSLFHFKPQHFDDEFLTQGSLYVKGLKRTIILLLTKKNSNGEVIPQGAAARGVLGRALHAIQDYYSHTNWVELGKTQINDNLGRDFIEPAPGGQTCIAPDSEDLISGLEEITSGYWRGFAGCDDIPDVLKCRHGDPTGILCGGINKDTFLKEGFNQAKTLAIEATRDYVGQTVFEILGSTELTIDEKNKALRALLDKPETFKCTEECMPPYI